MKTLEWLASAPLEGPPCNQLAQGMNGAARTMQIVSDHAALLLQRYKCL